MNDKDTTQIADQVIAKIDATASESLGMFPIEPNQQQTGKTMNNPPAFPSLWRHDSPNELVGMTLRDYFAAAALCGMHARDCFDKGLASPEQRASIAYIDADAMLKAREQ